MVGRDAAAGRHHGGVGAAASVGGKGHRAAEADYSIPEATLVMEPGMAFTVEPMITIGSYWAMWRNGWTAVSADGGRSAQFEQTVLVTGDGVRC